MLSAAPEGLVLIRKLGNLVNAAESLETLAVVAGALGVDPRAARLWGAVARTRRLPLAGRRSRMDAADWTRTRRSGPRVRPGNPATLSGTYFTFLLHERGLPAGATAPRGRLRAF
jgi:hypothetical protein